MSRRRGLSPSASPPRCALGSEWHARSNLAKQTDFSEPLMRVNVDSAARYVGGWDESRRLGQGGGGLIETNLT